MRELLRGAIRLHVLHHATSGEVNGAWMADELARHGYQISPGTLYPTLHRMEQEGLLRSRRDVLLGRAVRLYRTTVRGEAVLTEERAVLAELAREVLGELAGTASPTPRPRRGGNGRGGRGQASPPRLPKEPAR